MTRARRCPEKDRRRDHHSSGCRDGCCSTCYDHHWCFAERGGSRRQRDLHCGLSRWVESIGLRPKQSSKVAKSRTSTLVEPLRGRCRRGKDWGDDLGEHVGNAKGFHTAGINGSNGAKDRVQRHATSSAKLLDWCRLQNRRPGFVPHS